MTKTYARIDGTTVVELLRTETPPSVLFHPALRWIEATNPGVEIGWVEGPAGLTPPGPRTIAESAAPVLPTLAELNARINELAARVAALSPR